MEPVHDFLLHDSELGALMRDAQWDVSPLGPRAQWPGALKQTLQIILASKHPMLVWWDANLYQFYNDAYRRTMGADRHPAMLGKPGKAFWSEVWGVVGPQIESVMAGGETTFHEDQLVPMTLQGALEDVWWNYGYSAIRDASGVRGVLLMCTDVTAGRKARIELETVNQRLSDEIVRREVIERQQALQLKIADRLRGLLDSGAIARAAFDLLSTYVPATQMNYAEVDPGVALFHIRHTWRRLEGTAVADRRGVLADLGSAVVDSLRSGLPVTIKDTETDPRTADCALAYASLETRSCMLMPIIKVGRLVAFFTLHQAQPYDWPAHYYLLIQDIADRVWSAMELASAHCRQQASENALLFEREAESERLKSMFEQAPGITVIFRGHDHVYEFVNAAHKKIVGERPLLGLPVRKALPELEGQSFVGLLDEAYRSGQPHSAVDVALALHRHENGPATHAYVDFVFQPIVNARGVVSGLFVQGIDSTERHMTKQALEATQQRLSEGVAAARMAIWDWDLVSEHILFSQNTVEVFGRSWARIGDVWESVYEDDLGRLMQAAEVAFAADASYEEVVRIKRPSGEPLWIQIHGKFIANDEGKPRVVRCVGIDVTNLKFAQRALQDADQRKDEFLAMLAHELRNPLAPIRAASQLLKMVHQDGQQVQRIATVIARQADHMTSLINDLLDVSRVTSGMVTLDRQEQNVWSIVAESIEQVMPLMQERKHRLTFDDSDTSAVILGDRKRLVQVLTNLLQNAAKYTMADGKIHIRVAQLENEVSISISDNGVGMHRELLPHVFELFSQEKRTSDRSQGGLGLGLALVQRLVALHEGRVLAESAGPGQGSTMTVFLPAFARPGAPVALQPAVSDAIDVRLRIMVVDDNVDAANVLGMWLEAYGHDVRVEYLPHAALEQAAIVHYDVFLLDIGLPLMDGNELARQLRQRPENAGATLIANTGYGGHYDRAASLQASFDHYLIKPLDLDVLSDLLGAVSAAKAAKTGAGLPITPST